MGASLLNLVDAVIREQGSFPLNRRRGALVVVDEMQSMPGVDSESMLSELGKFGASFVLATQRLAKLDDLSRTMRDTLLANVGCLAVFQVAGNDARTLVWELGKDRVTEDDIVSLPVHHCYVRALESGATRPGPGPRPAGDSPPVRGLAQHRAQVCPCPDPAYQPPAKPRLQTLSPTHHQTLGLTLLLPICTDKIPGQQHYKWLISNPSLTRQPWLDAVQIL